MKTYLRFKTSCGCEREIRVEGIWNPSPTYLLPLFPRFAKAFTDKIPHPSNYPTARTFKLVRIMDEGETRIVNYVEDY